MSSTELWFFKEHIQSGEYGLKSAGVEVRTPKFGYEECYIDINDTRYLVKHRTNAGSIDGTLDGKRRVVFYVRKHKNSIGE